MASWLATVLRAAAIVLGLAIAGAIHHVAAARGRRAGWVALGVVALPVLALPLVFPSTDPVPRFAVACTSALFVFKLHDLQHPATRHPSARELALFLANPSSGVLRHLDRARMPAPEENLRDLVRAAALTAVGGVATSATFWFAAELGRVSFWLEHSTKLLTGYVVVIGSTSLLVAVLRLFGPALPFMANIYTAPTPAEFWRRYNQVIGRYFHENVFRRSGGMRAPVRGTLLVFAVSSVLHEYVFGIVLERFQGWQTAFFMAQGLAVAATLRVRPVGRARRIAWTAATWAFNLTTGVLFVLSVNRIVPWWSAAPPFGLR
jgi:hypothetical protein